jgi:hypothetical protein
MDDLVKAVLAFRDEREWCLASGTIHVTYFFDLDIFAGISAGEY